MKPNPQLPTKDELKKALAGFRGAFITVAVFSGFLNLLMLAPSIYMMQVYDRVLGSRNVTTLTVLSLLVVGVYVFMGILEAIRTWVLVRVGASLDAQLNPRVFNATFERSLLRPGSNTTQPMVDLNSVRSSLTGPGLLTIFDAPWFPIYLVIIWMFSWELGVFALCGAVLLAGLALLNERVTKSRLDEANKASILSQNALNNHLRNAEVIEAMGMLPAIRRRWRELHDKQLKLQAMASDQAAVLSGATKYIRIGMQSLVLGYGAYLTLEGKMTSGMMIAASILVSRALAPAEMLVGNWKSIVNGRIAYARLTELLIMHPARTTGMELPVPKGEVKAEAASATAPGSRTFILKQLSFTITAGEVIAMIGPSGSGKSTLARLLVGVWPATTGHVRLDGADLFTWNKDELGPYIGYLPQDIELFDGTVAENIARFGEVDAEQVVQAAQRAGMHEQILRLERGYDTPLGVGGNALSGGQRQRIGLARALYGDPVLIVLDEPNSNLDDAGERALIDTVRDLKIRGKTVVLITHRVSVLGSVDKIMFLNDGTIAAFGPRDEILKALQGKGNPGAPSAPGQAVGPGLPRPAAATVTQPMPRTGTGNP
jgi:ATP-binding cassette subfamily C exporter for protease/lipase